MKVFSDQNLSQLLSFLAGQEQFVFLDTAKPGPENYSSLLFLSPVRRLQCRVGEDVCAFLAQVTAALSSGYHVAGWFAYEFGYLLEERLQGMLSRPEDASLLLADLGVFLEPCFFDHRSGKTTFPCFLKSTGGFSSVPAGCEATLPESFCQVQNIRPSQSREAYIQAIDAIQHYIRAGDTYQVNYTLKLLFDLCGSPESLYAMLRRNQSVAYGAYVHLGETRLLSFSPELFFKKDADSIMVRPMKGTMPRGRFPEEDCRQAEYLRNDAKNRSENVMIVDLLRNDLGRLMRGLGDGPVRTCSLFDVERYETLLQMTSTIIASGVQETLATLPLVKLFQALFPCGSVTGAPKLRTMEIIDELESERRGVYTGAIGYLAPTGAALFNVPIRTVTLDGLRGEMGIGSGIVADSKAEQEWQECLLKGQFLSSSAPAFELIETLLWEPESGYWLLGDHLQRLASSADYFLYRCDLVFITFRLQEESRLFAMRPMRVRLTLAKDGRVSISSQPCALPGLRRLPDLPFPADAGLPQIEISPVVIDSTSPWIFHKTTRREVYNSELERVRNQGMLDCCFFNERGELTEGCVANIILYLHGFYVTPALQCGLLAGIMRKKMLADTQISLREEVLTLDDLRDADAVFLCNSVRGVVQVAGSFSAKKM
ncbi:MAG: aminodeoxychorismate synthase component I [Desulfobulbaceae bacterium]|jgi:para-aminobenzoate synthetase/4-amino-4-deoxychorismate lyase|nr:aminodeoxychorismate synthase component I [Desulfobulbaceae bacterium]